MTTDIALRAKGLLEVCGQGHALRRKLLLLLVGMALSLASLRVVCGGPDRLSFAGMLHATPYAGIASLSGIYVAMYLLRGFRFHCIPSAGARRGFRLSCCAVVIGKFVNNVLPLKLGEGAKAAVLHRNGAGRLPDISFLIVAERCLDAFGVFLMLIASLLYVDHAMIAPVLGRYGQAMLPVAAAVLLAAGIGYLLRRRLPALSGTVLRNLKPMARPRLLAPVLVQSIVLSMMEGVMFYQTARIYGSGIPMGVAFVAAAVVNITTIVPSAPSDVGIFHLSVVSILVLFGTGRGEALKIAVAVHFVQLAVSIVIGMASVAFLRHLPSARYAVPSHG